MAIQPDQMMGIRVSGDGNILITGENGSIGMQFPGLGRNQSLTGMPVSAIRANGTRLDIIRDNVTEWYGNGNTGIEQGMTIATRPEGTRDVPGNVCPLRNPPSCRTCRSGHYFL